MNKVIINDGKQLSAMHLYISKINYCYFGFFDYVCFIFNVWLHVCLACIHKYNLYFSVLLV